jgi:transcriptional regulator with XRE-family HTH domain
MNSLQLKEIRKELGLTQSEFANSLDFHLRTVQKWESGETKMRKGNIIAVKDLYNKTLKISTKEAEGLEEEEKDIEVLYKEHMDFKRALKVIKNEDYKAYEIHKQTGLNESGLRRVLNNEIENPQAKTKKGIIKFARSIAPDLESQENTDFRDLKIDDKLNVLFNQMQIFKELEKSVNEIKEDVALNHEIVIKTDRSLNLYSTNINLVLTEMQKERKKNIKLG